HQVPYLGRIEHVQAFNRKRNSSPRELARNLIAVGVNAIENAYVSPAATGAAAGVFERPHQVLSLHEASAREHGFNRSPGTGFRFAVLVANRNQTNAAIWRSGALEGEFRIPGNERVSAFENGGGGAAVASE